MSARRILGRMARVGIGVTPIMMGRINRPVIVPLIGETLHLPATVISLVFGAAALLEHPDDVTALVAQGAAVGEPGGGREQDTAQDHHQRHAEATAPTRRPGDAATAAVCVHGNS